MRNKLLCLLAIAFITSGCEIEYNLNIEDDKFSESISAFANENESENTSFPSIDLYNEYSSKPIPLYNDSMIQSESDDKLPNVEYYKTTDISTENTFGVNWNGSFTISNIEKSTVINYAYGNFQLTQNDTEIKINTIPNFKLFDQFENLDKVRINIRTNYKVLESNADEVKDNTYTWNINRNNYMNKPINMTITKDSTIQSVAKNIEKSINNNSASKDLFIIYGGCVLLIILVILLITIKLKKNNEL